VGTTREVAISGWIQINLRITNILETNAASVFGNSSTLHMEAACACKPMVSIVANP
jgi:hypothetical protein